MKVKFVNKENYFSEKEMDAVKEFSKFLQSELPLKTDILISFEKERQEPMTTGVRLPKHKIHILAKNRLLIDVLRTLSHEWVHEFQHQKMGLKDTDKIQDIGGPEENMANVLSGIFLKKFIKNFPQHKKSVFGELD
jgi:hypothetical protein